ncbi:MAG: AAA family ATPase [Candidatus Thermoplasmatota archaeon]|nr:AAA family ATPase [Candidatus Thermoplasmatota archaeon]
MAWIKEVRLENFMSYDYARIPLKDGVNLVVGPNGSGKSSILLAISLAFGQIYTERSKKLSDLIKWGKDAARVSLLIDNSKKNGRRTFGFSNSDTVMISRYIKSDGSYWYEIDYREASLYEVQSIFKRIGINPSNMLIIMHQNTLERFSALKPEEKLSLLEDAVGFGSYRSRIIDSRKKLQSVRDELEEVEKNSANANETLAYWNRVYEGFLQKKKLEEKLDSLALELSWAKVLREEKALAKLEKEAEKKKKDVERLEKEIGLWSAEAEKMREELLRSISEELLEAYVKKRVDVALNAFKIELLKGEILSLNEEIKRIAQYIESTMPQGARMESNRTTKEIEEEIGKTKEEVVRIGDIPDNAEEVYRSFADEFYKVEEKRKELEGNRDAVGGELKEREKKWREKVEGLIKGIEPRFRAILREVDGDGYIKVVGQSVEESGLEIYVGFKSNEPRLLDPMTHSGGERAAATMAFLLAIQQNIKSKFRAIDEFDVHMDLRNRERIYNIIISSVKEDEQYLIITPNQITVRDERMGIIVVQRSGEALAMKREA